MKGKCHKTKIKKPKGEIIYSKLLSLNHLKDAWEEVESYRRECATWLNQIWSTLHWDCRGSMKSNSEEADQRNIGSSMCSSCLPKMLHESEGKS
jgi:hypothetical protein